jgi:hypothetical protein
MVAGKKHGIKDMSEWKKSTKKWIRQKQSRESWINNFF